MIVAKFVRQNLFEQTFQHLNLSLWKNLTAILYRLVPAMTNICQYVTSFSCYTWNSELTIIQRFLVYVSWTYGKCLWLLLWTFLDLERIILSFVKLYNTDFYNTKPQTALCVLQEKDLESKLLTRLNSDLLYKLYPFIIWIS